VLRMSWVIIKQRWRVLARERTFWITVALLGLAIGYGFFDGWSRLREERQAERVFAQQSYGALSHNRELDLAIEQRIAAGQEQERIPPPFGSRHPVYVAAWCRLPAMLPPSPLGWLAVGNSDLYPVAYAGPEHDEVSQISNPLKVLYGHWDLCFTAVCLFPLVILALSFDLIASEKENGILRLLLSQPIRSHTIVVAKAAASASIVFGAAVAFFLAGLIVSGIDWSPAMAVRLLFFALTAAAYGVFWLGLAVCINTLGWSAAMNALILSISWLCLVVLAPFTINQIATWSHPIPPRSELVNAERSIPEAVQKIDSPQLVAGFLGRHPEVGRQADMTDLGKMYLAAAARREEVQRRIQAEQERFEAQLGRQQRFVNRLSVLAPAVLLQNTLVELAGTGRARHLDFLRQKSDYEKQYDAFFLRKKLALPDSIFRAADYASIPAMSYEEERLGTVLGRTLPGFAIVALYAGASLTAALARVRRFSLTTDLSM
jgi:ABC-2 type transport system permease protein